MQPQVNRFRSTGPAAVTRPQDAKAEQLSEDHIHHDDGRFQWVVLACSALSVLAFSYYALSFQLTAVVMNHWCLPPDGIGNLTPAHWRNASIPIEEDGSYSRCTMYDPRSTAENATVRIVVPCRAWDFNLTQYGNTIISEWSLVCNRSWLVPLDGLVFTSGTVIGLPILGMASDRIGRRPVVCACVAVLIITALACALTKSFLFFVVVRFAVAASSSSLMTTMFVILYEVTTPAKWALYGTINAALAFVILPIAFIVLSLLRLDWMAIYLVFMVPTSSLVATFYLVPESPRWLLATWQLKKAEQVTFLVARINRTPLDHARVSFSRAANRMRGGICDNDVPLTIALRGLLRQPKHRRSAILLFYSWFAIDFAYSATTTSEHLIYSHWVPLVYVASTLPSFVALFLCLAYFGRKKVTVAVTVLTSIQATFLVLTYNHGNPTLAAGVVIVLLQLSSSVSYAAVFIFTVELFPTVFRSIGMSTGFACGSVGTILASLLTEFEGTAVRKDLLLFFVAVLSVVGALALQTLPDTAGAVLFSRRQKAISEDDRKHALVASLEPHSAISKWSASRAKDHSRSSQAPCLASGVGALSTLQAPSAAHDSSQGSSTSSKLRTIRQSVETLAGREGNH